MTRNWSLGVLSFVLLAAGAGTTSSALALEAKILSNGAAITTLLFFTMSEEFLIEDMGAIGKPAILCSGTWDGMIEAGGTTVIYESLLMLSGELLTAAILDSDVLEDIGDDLECESLNSTCTGSPLVVANNLPWKANVELVTLGGKEEFVLNLTLGLPELEKMPEFVVVCTTALGLVEDQCYGETYSLMENLAEGLMLEFDEEKPATLSFECALSKPNHEGLLASLGFMVDTEGSTLTVS